MFEIQSYDVLFYGFRNSHWFCMCITLVSSFEISIAASSLDPWAINVIRVDTSLVDVSSSPASSAYSSARIVTLHFVWGRSNGDTSACVIIFAECMHQACDEGYRGEDVSLKNAS